MAQRKTIDTEVSQQSQETIAAEGVFRLDGVGWPEQMFLAESHK
jgi:hypothetical protein